MMEDKDKKLENTEKIIDNVEMENNDDLKPEGVTREINLDDLYDGAVNNTVIIDPVTNEEMLLETKKHNHKVVGIMLSVLVLLVLYFINNKMDLKKEKANVVPNSTTTVTTVVNAKKGTLNCTYSSSASSQKEDATFMANYENDKIIDTKFTYVVVLSSDSMTDMVKNLLEQYENYFIANVSVPGFLVGFEKDEKGFTFNSNADYKSLKFDNIIVKENETILYAKPSSSDTTTSLLDTYSNKGYKCTLTQNDK